jgi:hypothetical protein
MLTRIDDTDIDDDDEEGLHPIDLDALERAIAIVRLSPGRSNQIDAKLRDESWQDVAAWCAYVCQCKSLKLEPWQRPPCWVEDMEGDIARGDDGVVGKYAAAQLLKRMLAAGVSMLDPDPLAALKAVGK